MSLAGNRNQSKATDGVAQFHHKLVAIIARLANDYDERNHLSDCRAGIDQAGKL